MRPTPSGVDVGQRDKITFKVTKLRAEGGRATKMASGVGMRDKAHAAHTATAVADLLRGDIRREDTDDSSLTSAISETFDRIPDTTSSSMSKSDVNGLLQYSSADAGAEDTGLSSVSSNGHFEDAKIVKTPKAVPDGYFPVSNGNKSRKRIALSTATPPKPSVLDTIVVNNKNARPRSQTDLQSFSTPSTDTLEIPVTQSPKVRKSPKSTARKPEARPSSSIPPHMAWQDYGRQCCLAAHMSRLNPYALHTGEHRLLRDRMPHSHVTNYLNIRNGILRLWTRNPMVSVTQDEAMGCAKETRFFELATFAYKWLVRNGYINFGCVEVPRPAIEPPKGRRSSKQRTIAVIGAGMSGLGCARQLEGLIAQLSQQFVDKGEHPPRVIVLEGRKRIGGRVYSHPLRSQVDGSLPDHLRNTAEMGAQIITGFEHGNPLNVIVRGQLGLRYHLMWDEVVMHDTDGRAVNLERDMLVNSIHNDLLERTTDFRIKPTSNDTLEGFADLVDECQDPFLSNAENEFLPSMSESRPNNAANTLDKTQAVPPGFAKLQGRTQVVAGNSSNRTAAQAAKSAGWELRPGISRNHTVNLEAVANSSACPTLGATMDEAVRQYQKLVQLTPQDMRLLNWHYADLEYANAATVSQLSLGGHDQDTGNEFEGRHSEVVGGYIQVPRGLLMLPNRLDVHFDRIVKKVRYSNDVDGQAVIECEDGESFEADKVVLTSPLGVLKAQAIAFEPPLPDWKRGAIDRLGFGLLNKIVLVYERSFWDEKFDMFGMLNAAEKADSMNPDDFEKGRGRFYLTWNCVKNSGRPMLIALMAGRAAHEAETKDTATLLKEVTAKLSKAFSPQIVPAPVEVIVTRWKKDPFTRGTYSNVGPETRADDYDTMAAPVGNLHFAGEATCGTHPATVHGAYLSGLRAAAEVVESIIGPTEVPQPLIRQGQTLSTTLKPVKAPLSPPRITVPSVKIRLKHTPQQTVKIKEEEVDTAPFTSGHFNPYRSSNNSRCTLNDEHEALVQSAIFSQIGQRPLKPGRSGVNPFLIYTSDHWNECKAACTAERQKASGKMDAKATRHEVRTKLGLWWRTASEDVKRPYIERCEAAQQLANEARAQYERDIVKWEDDARRIREEYIREHPVVSRDEGGSVEDTFKKIGLQPRKRSTL